MGWPSSHPATVVIGRVCVCSVARSFLTLCDSVDCSPPGSSVHVIPQARILEWVGISSPELGIKPVSPA